MTFAEYQAIDAINATALKAGQLSMLHMRHVMTGGEREQTPAMRWGSIVHKAILEPASFFASVAVFEGVKRGKDWEAFKAAHDHDCILSRSEQEELFALSQAVHANRDAHALIEETRHELTVTWETAEYGKAKARLDGYSERRGIMELKTARIVANDAFGAACCGSLHYDVQFGWYVEGVSAMNASDATVPVTVIAVESVPPFDVAVYRVPELMVHIARGRARQTATEYRRHEAEGTWPGVSQGVQELRVPSWYGQDETEKMFAEFAKQGGMVGDE